MNPANPAVCRVCIPLTDIDEKQPINKEIKTNPLTNYSSEIVNKFASMRFIWAQKTVEKKVDIL